MSADVMPRGTVKTFFVELGDIIEGLIKTGIVGAIKFAVKYLYQKIRHRLKKPEPVNVYPGVVSLGPLTASASVQVVNADVASLGRHMGRS